MTYAFRIAILLTFAAMPGLVPAHAASTSLMEGRWFTEGVERGAHIQVFIDNKPDGSYEKDLRVIENCEVAGRAKETGKWKFEQDGYATVSEAVNGKPVGPDVSAADKNDFFRVTRVDNEHVNLFDTETNLNWALTLVPATLDFPAPQGCTV